MALTIQIAPIGSNLDGTTGAGEVPFLSPTDDDTQRIELLSVSVQSPSDTKTAIDVVLAPSLADVALGTFLQIGSLANVAGLNQSCCRCIVPRGWNLYATTTGPTTGTTTLIADWHRVTLEGRA